MFLSRLVLEGFKSYSEPVEVEFGPHIAVIIGSNGVGKSNALEGIMWALGEDDPRALRCRGGHDLLFAGSNLAAPADEALVELAFEHDDKEFAISRSFAKSGEERFMVCGARVGSLDQYRGALSELGLGHGKRTVIRQEELTDLFMRSPEERKRYVGDYVSSHEKLDEVNRLFEGYLQAMIPGTRAAVVFDHNGDEADVEVTFPDKGLRRGLLLSGGERAVTSLALKLALFECLESPVYILDEVEPSLDWTRNHNMQNLLKRLAQDRQLIIVTHFQSTIQMANTVHGVRIRPDGSSWLKFHFLMDERLFKVYKCC